LFLLWRRQGGKSTLLAEAALAQMMGRQGRLVTYASASLLLGRELILKESTVLHGVLPHLRSTASQAQMRLEAVDGQTGRGLPESVDLDEFTALFETQRLQLRLWHDRVSQSRTQVIAPNPATARGWTGMVLIDEFGFIPDFAALWEAIEPIISTNPQFRLLGATTPSADDNHFSFGLTVPPMDLIFPGSPAGNWYQSEAGKLIHRVDLHDAHAAGLKLYDLDSGAEISPAEHFARAQDKDAWRRNYGIIHVRGGTAAVGLDSLETAQARGVEEARCFLVDFDSDFEEAVAWTRLRLGSSSGDHGTIGLGWDLATTEKEMSNPSAFAIVERRESQWILRTLVLWKTQDPGVARLRARRLVEATISPVRRPRRLCVDGTNERYFASEILHDLAPLVIVEVVVASTVVKTGGDGSITMKAHLGSRLVRLIEEGQMILPPGSYVSADIRRVQRDRGSFRNLTGPGGEHGDVFDAAKLAVYAVVSTGEGAVTDVSGIRAGRAGFQPRRWARNG
jgi:hypothetical protein